MNYLSWPQVNSPRRLDLHPTISIFVNPDHFQYFFQSFNFHFFFLFFHVFLFKSIPFYPCSYTANIIFWN